MDAAATCALTWAATTAERELAARFFANVIAADGSYISHGEIQQGLSPDGVRWADDLETRLLNEFSGEGESGVIALAYHGDMLVGAASVAWMPDAEAPYATLADLAVAPEARQHGVGAALVAFIEAEARSRGLGWVFLESGLGNHGAHDFFMREGYAAISKVFAKRL